MVKMNDTITVGITPRRAVSSLDKRTSLTIVNMSSTAVVYYGSDNQVSVNNGIPIRPKTAVSFLEGLGDRPDLERWVISDTANTDVRIGEETKKSEEG